MNLRVNELKLCPLCGARPHQGLTKIQYDQLHGEPFQNYEIWCPKLHVKVHAVNREQAEIEWNHRFALTDTEGAGKPRLPADRCDFCDNGIEPDWAFCPGCSRSLDYTKAAPRAALSPSPIGEEKPEDFIGLRGARDIAAQKTQSVSRFHSPAPVGDIARLQVWLSRIAAHLEIAGSPEHVAKIRQAAEALSHMEEREKELTEALSAKDVKLKPLKWQYSNGHYPEWSAYCPAIDKTFRIDKSEALCFGKYPLRIDNYRPKNDGFASLAEAKAFAEQYRGDTIREALDLRRARNLLAGKEEGK